jgi:serine/threonine protein kinase
VLGWGRTNLSAPYVVDLALFLSLELRKQSLALTEDYGAVCDLAGHDFLKLEYPRGTVPFTPVEMQYENAASKFVDIFSFGVTIWSMFHCRVPTTEDIETVQNIGRQMDGFKAPFMWPRVRSDAMEVFHSLPQEWSALITRCLQLDPTHRGTVYEIAAAWPELFPLNCTEQDFFVGPIRGEIFCMSWGGQKPVDHRELRIVERRIRVDSETNSHDR